MALNVLYLMYFYIFYTRRSKRVIVKLKRCSQDVLASFPELPRDDVAISAVCEVLLAELMPLVEGIGLDRGRAASITGAEIHHLWPDVVEVCGLN